MKPLGETPITSDTTTDQPADPGRRAFLAAAGTVLAATAARAMMPGLAQAAEGSEAEATAARVQAMKASVTGPFNAPQYFPNLAGMPELLSPAFLQRNNLQFLGDGEPMQAFTRTSAMDGLNPTDEVAMNAPLKAGDTMHFMFMVFIPRGQKGFVNITWERNGEVYNGERAAKPHVIGKSGVSASNGYRLHDEFHPPQDGHWKATVTMDVEKDGEEGTTTVELGSFEVDVAAK